MDHVIRCGSINELSDAMFDRSATDEPRVYTIGNYVTPQVAHGIKSAFSSSTRDSGSSIYGSSAIPLYEYREESGNSLQDYLGQAESLWLGHRMLMAAFDDPVSHFMTELGVATGKEVRRLTLLDKPCFFGQFRCFTEMEDVEPHVDIIEHEFPTLLDAPARQWALNISMCVSEVGGDLQIWDHVPTSDEYKGYGLAQPQTRPAVTFKPSVGDLYLFEPRYVHAITASHGPRCALAGFLAEWTDSSLRAWS